MQWRLRAEAKTRLAVEAGVEDTSRRNDRYHTMLKVKKKIVCSFETSQYETTVNGSPIRNNNY